MWAVVSAGYSALLSSSYSERINDDDDDEMAMQPREPAQCQLYRHTFVAYRSELAECPRSNSCWPRCGQSAYAVDASLSACRRQGARLLLIPFLRPLSKAFQFAIRFDLLCKSIRIYSFCKKSAFRFTSCHAVFLAYLLYSIGQNIHHNARN